MPDDDAPGDVGVTEGIRKIDTGTEDRARQATVVSVHNTAAEAFAEIDRLADRMVRTGDRSDAVELIVVDDAANVVARPAIQ